MKITHQFVSALGIALFLSGCAVPPARPANAKQANAAYQRGDLAAALQSYLAWPGGNDDPHVQAMIGNCAALLGQVEQAQRAYRRSLALDPEQPAVRFNLAVLHLKQAQAQLIAALPQSGQQPALQQRIQTLLAQIDQPHPSAMTPSAAHALEDRKP